MEVMSKTNASSGNDDLFEELEKLRIANQIAQQILDQNSEKMTNHDDNNLDSTIKQSHGMYVSFMIQN